DIGMVQARCRARFLLETLDAPAVGVQVAGQDLDGDLTPEAGIAGTIDLSHPAGTERRQNLVGAETRARLQRNCLPAQGCGRVLRVFRLSGFTPEHTSPSVPYYIGGL